MTTTLAKVTARRSRPLSATVSRSIRDSSCRRAWDRGGVRVRKRLMTVAAVGGLGTIDDA